VGHWLGWGLVDDGPQWPLQGVVGVQGWMTMRGLRTFLRVALIIALALVNFVILGFAAYTIFLIAKWLVGLVW
jgi:hypothetical protein